MSRTVARVLASARARVVARLVAPLLAGLLLPLSLSAPSYAAGGGLPSAEQWHADVKAALAGPGAQPSASRWIRRQIAHRDGRALALNLDIDNTSLATHYDWPHATPHVDWLIRTYQTRGVTMLFNTGRFADQLAGVRRALRNAGYDATEICGRRHGERTAHSKQRCRRHFINEGYTLIAVIANYPVDFSGPRNYGQAYRLPNYGGKLL